MYEVRRYDNLLLSMHLHRPDAEMEAYYWNLNTGYPNHAKVVIRPPTRTIRLSQV